MLLFEPLQNPISDQAEIMLALATRMYDEIVAIPKNIRADEKTRTGLQILVREIGTDNLFLGSVYQPSHRAQFFVTEKAIRSEILNHFSSSNSADPTQLRFDGSVTILFGSRKIQASTSGLFGFEDVAVSIKLLSFLTKWPVDTVMKHIADNKGVLPIDLYTKNHYLHPIIHTLAHV